VTDVVSISVPAAPGWTGVVELVLAGLGARLDLPYDRIDELQLATTAVLEDAVGPDVRVDASARADSVDIRVGPLGAAAGGCSMHSQTGSLWSPEKKATPGPC
jgi:hypothetical protein